MNRQHDVTDDDDDREFSPSERRAMRKILKQEERVAWVWSSIRLGLGWASAAIIAAYGVYQALSGSVSALLKKVGAS